MQQQTFTNMEQLKAKIKSNPYVKATALLILAPVAAYDWLEKHKVGVLCSLATTALLVLFVFVCGSCGEDKDEYTPTLDADLQIVNLQAAFTTGNKRTSTEFLVIHHTAGKGKVNDICRVHFGERKWSTVGYPFVIDEDGTVYQLKPDDEVSPHSYHYNNNSIAICCIGNFNNYPMPKAQYEALCKLTRRLMKKFNLTKNDILRHCDLKGNNTECPGKYFNLQQFKKDL